jgi:hypothetical protein
VPGARASSCQIGRLESTSQEGWEANNASDFRRKRSLNLLSANVG